MTVLDTITKKNVTVDGREVKILITSGVFSELHPIIIKQLLDSALEKLKDKTSWVVFRPEAEECSFEDEGRTCIIPLKTIIPNYNEKLYAILDDYGNVEALQYSAGDKTITTQYVLTLLFASEY